MQAWGYITWSAQVGWMETSHTCNAFKSRCRGKTFLSPVVTQVWPLYYGHISDGFIECGLTVVGLLPQPTGINSLFATLTHCKWFFGFDSDAILCRTWQGDGGSGNLVYSSNYYGARILICLITCKDLILGNTSWICMHEQLYWTCTRSLDWHSQAIVERIGWRWSSQTSLFSWTFWCIVYMATTWDLLWIGFQVNYIGMPVKVAS